MYTFMYVCLFVCPSEHYMAYAGWLNSSYAYVGWLNRTQTYIQFCIYEYEDSSTQQCLMVSFLSLSPSLSVDWHDNLPLPVSLVRWPLH